MACTQTEDGCLIVSGKVLSIVFEILSVDFIFPCFIDAVIKKCFRFLKKKFSWWLWFG